MAIWAASLCRSTAVPNAVSSSSEAERYHRARADRQDAGRRGHCETDDAVFINSNATELCLTKAGRCHQIDGVFDTQ